MKIVVALGGNALGDSPRQQKELVKKSSIHIVDLIEEGHEIILTHGNGPQVGMINLAFEESKKTNNNIADFPFAECNAMSQGYIGYHLQNAIGEELRRRYIIREVSTIITQVVVDKEDPAFKKPSKPIGRFLTKDEAEKLGEKTGYSFIEDAGRGYRRVIASPRPLELVELDSISTLVDKGNIVIATGGGGVPVYRDGNSLIGIDAVIDKDFASAKLAEELGADCLMILTVVENVSLNFGRENEEKLGVIDVKTLDKYIQEGHFAKGSMLPKVEAAKEFASSKKDRRSVITSLENASKVFSPGIGTWIIG